MPKTIPSNVVIMNDFCLVKGGTSRIAIDEALGLAARGIKVHYFGAVGPVCAELTSVPNLEVTCLGQNEILDSYRNPLIAVQGLWNFRAARVLKQILKAYAPAQTVVHLHGYSKALTGSVVRPALSAGFPFVHTLHDYFSACPNGGFLNYRTGTVCPLRGGSLACLGTNCDKRNYVHKLYRYIKSFLQKYVAGMPRKIRNFAYLSESSLALLTPYLPPDARTHFIENINETPRAEPVDVAAYPDFVFAGQLEPHKGIACLMAAAARAGASVIFVGDGPLRPDIERAGYKVTGWLPRAEVQGWIETARCLVFPSLWAETYGLVVTEALARGVPAIVSDVTAAAERIEPGRSGWVCKAGDVDDLARCMTEALDPAKVSSYGRAAYDKFWAAPPTREAHIDRLLDIYEVALSGR